jgi:hypothetical protein
MPGATTTNRERAIQWLNEAFGSWPAEKLVSSLTELLDRVADDAAVEMAKNFVPVNEPEKLEQVSREAATLPPSDADPNRQVQWIGECRKCFAVYGVAAPANKPPCTDDKGHSYGNFCPDCRAQKQMLVGVVHFTRFEEIHGEQGAQPSAVQDRPTGSG